MNRNTLTRTLPICAAIIIGAVVIAPGGDLTPPAGPPGPTMVTLGQIHSLLQSVQSAVLANSGSSCSARLPDDPLYAGIDLSAPAPDAYLFVFGVAGESTGPGHAGWIDLLSVGQMIDVPTAGGAVLGPVRVLADIDKSLPTLLRRAAAGTHTQTAEIELLHPTSAVVFLEVQLKDVTVTSVTPVYQLGAAILEFDYDEVHVIYHELDAGGQPTGTTTEFCWDKQLGNVCS